MIIDYGGKKIPVESVIISHLFIYLFKITQSLSSLPILQYVYLHILRLITLFSLLWIVHFR